MPTTFEKSVSVTLAEQHAHAYIKCHYLGDEQSAFRINTVQTHEASNTTSKLIVKSVLEDNATFTNNSKIVVEKDLQHVTCEQLNKNLMLSESAQVISSPTPHLVHI